MGQVGFWGPFLALLGRFLTPLGPSVGPNVYILSSGRYQNHLEPNQKWSEDPRNVILYENTYLRKTRFLAPNLAFLHTKWAQMGSIGGSRRLILGFWGSQTIWEPKQNDLEQKFFSKNVFFWPFLNPILAILCVKSKMAPFGGLEGSKMSFFGPKTH